jgi:hypothetical protein
LWPVHQFVLKKFSYLPSNITVSFIAPISGDVLASIFADLARDDYNLVVAEPLGNVAPGNDRYWLHRSLLLGPIRILTEPQAFDFGLVALLFEKVGGEEIILSFNVLPKITTRHSLPFSVLE